MTVDISFEFFPYQSPESVQTLCQTAERLKQYNPQFFSVTFGAGGSAQEYSINTVTALLQQNEVAVAPHISCVNIDKPKMQELLTHYRNLGVKRLVVLRGDLPSGFGQLTGELRYASDLVNFIRETHGDYFHIHVAAYPECHPQSEHFNDDLNYFKHKVDAGANGAITQYFYNADAYYHLLARCAKANITVPIVPGIMPITNYKQLARFSNVCGAEIPRWITKVLESHADDVDAIKDVGEMIVTRLCEQLLAMGAPGLHFYTLNKGAACEKLLQNLKIEVCA